MGSGVADIFGRISQFLKTLQLHFNPIGKLYIQVQLLCRVLVCGVFLDDLFGKVELKCDTNQLGCNQNCINRYAPVTHNKLWQAELFLVMISTTLFSAFSLFHNYAVREYSKKLNDNTRSKHDFLLKKANVEERSRHSKNFRTSAIIRFGYKIMLIIRLFFEIFCCYLEGELGTHQSQNAGFWDRFHLKETWICPTNNPEYSIAQEEMLPFQNRSELFFRNELNLACIQQHTAVTCWIPFSWMKSLGLIFMYWVMLLTTFLTFCELMYELIPCTGRRESLGSRPSSAKGLDISDKGQV